ncbi:MAG: hypothetical protein Q9177_003608, partial [Variospora cf. flavescens]
WRSRKGQRAERPQRADYEEVTKTNPNYEAYYNHLSIFRDDEKTEFWAALRRELPNSFRFTGSKGHALPVQKILKERYIPEIESIEYEGSKVEPPTPVPWFPNQLAWQMTTPKNVVRKFAPFKSFQQFLVSETSVGNISRQEIVSMIPPLLMGVTPGMVVLDLCAAPGSKSAQLIEMLHGGEEGRIREMNRDHEREEEHEASAAADAITAKTEREKQQGDWSDQGRSTGLLICNDVDYKRAHMLIHQMKRLNSPNLIVTNHDATMYPSIKLPTESKLDSKQTQHKYLKFDRVLADVPCTGDGTSRKNVNVWRDWIPGNALGLHSTQVRILVRALQMTKLEGRVIYSTCSMNPIENEAVVASAIARCGGLTKVAIVDCKDELPGLIRRPGLNTWNVMDRTAVDTYKTWEEVQDNPGKLVEGMFPPKEPFPLDRCMRVYPHLQDTGGFFITVLEKKSEIKAKPEGEPRQTKPKPSIFAVVDEIEAKPTNGTIPMDKIDALDSIAPPQASEDGEGISAAARQNKEVAPNEPLSARKHELDDQADIYMSAKRLKVRDEIGEPAPRGAEDRQVHWPPPPGAQLDISRPEAAKLPEPNDDLLADDAIISPFSESVKRVSSDYKGKRNSGQQPFEEPFKYLPADHPELLGICRFFNISSNFPRSRFMVRNATGEPVKSIYYTSSLARDILTTNEGSGLKFVHCGVKMFVKQDVQKENTCKWRIQTDGLPVVEPWVGEERVVRLTKKSTLKKLLVEMFPKVNGEGWEDLGEIGERVRDIEYGCCVLKVEKGEGEDAFSERIILPLWRSLHSLNLMLPKEDRKAMLLRLFNEIIPLQDHSKDRFLKAANNVANTGIEGESVEDAAVEDLPEEKLDLQAAMDATSDEEASVEQNTVEPGLKIKEGEQQTVGGLPHWTLLWVPEELDFIPLQPPDLAAWMRELDLKMEFGVGKSTYSDSPLLPGIKVIDVSLGQGVQRVGMTTAWLEAFPKTCIPFLEEADDILRMPLSRIIAEGPNSTLTATENAQPAIMATSVMILRVLEKEFGFKTAERVDITLGHSLGEFAALVTSQHLRYEDALKMLRRRAEVVARCSREAAKSGGSEYGMVALVCEPDHLSSLIETIDEFLGYSSEGFHEDSAHHVPPIEQVRVANVNSKNQLVLSGRIDKINALLVQLRQFGGHDPRAVRLSTNSPFHSPIMAPAEKAMREMLDKTDISFPALFPCISNISSRPFESVANIKDLLARQCVETVRWWDSIKYLDQEVGVRRWIGIGPGKVGRNLVGKEVGMRGRDTVRGGGVWGISDPREIEEVLRGLEGTEGLP